MPVVINAEIILFKASAVVAMDLDCCCTAGVCEGNCEWIWLEGEARWIEETFNCNFNQDGCTCPDGPPPTPGDFDGERRVYGECTPP
jgi:hypothetical protein